MYFRGHIRFQNVSYKSHTAQEGLARGKEMQMEPRILRLRDVQLATALSKATIYRLLNAAAFPRPIRLSSRAVGWRTEEIHEWLASRERAGGMHANVDSTC